MQVFGVGVFVVSTQMGVRHRSDSSVTQQRNPSQRAKAAQRDGSSPPRPADLLKPRLLSACGKCSGGQKRCVGITGMFVVSAGVQPPVHVHVHGPYDCSRITLTLLVPHLF